MERIKSFTIDHMTLLPGVYESRRDAVSTAEAIPGTNALCPVTTFDIRITRPNFEPVMSTGEIHTIEHIGATYLRNKEGVKENVIYWGPMGCRTGFYLIMAGAPSVDEIKELMKELFAFTADFEGAIPGATPVECGNYSDMDLDGAKKRAAHYLELLNK